MQKIIIYYGPKHDFEKIIPEEKQTLSEFIIKDDAKYKSFSVKMPQEVSQEEVEPDYIENIVAYSESYACITEGAIQRFTSLFERYEIDNLYLQNPPLQIQTRLEQTFPGIIERHYFQYNTVSTKTLKKFYRTFSQKIIGQEIAKKKVLASFYPLVKKSNNNKPVVLMFYGPSGIGKTETAKFISELLDQKIFRRQFSMFHSNEFADYMFGGNHFQNSFAKELLERKSNVILLDEFDKAAPVFYSAFYQLFDEGIFEDKNYKVKIDNAIIICTSNYQSVEDIKKHLGDPIFYRIGKFIEFEKLSLDATKTISSLIVDKKYSKLDADEKAQIDVKRLKNVLHSKASLLKNVRHISTLVDDHISEKLVERLINN